MPLDFPNPSVSTTYTDSTSGNTYTFANGSWSLTSILSATKGGTGFASYNRGDILFGNASGTLSKLGAGTAGSVLSTNGTGADPTWITLSAGGAGTVATPGARYQIAGYYPGTGASVSGSSTFTNDTSTGIVSITHATGSTSPSFGALLVSGGVGIAGTLSYYKSQLGVAGTTSLPSMAFIGNTNNPVYLNVLENNALSFEGYQGQLLSISPDLNTGYVFTVGDISGIPLLRANANANVTANEFGGNFGIGTTNPLFKLEVNGQTAITGSTASTSTTTGALVVTGGVGIALTSYFGQSVFIQGTTASGSTTTGALVVSGGVGIGASVNIGGRVGINTGVYTGTLNITTPSASTLGIVIQGSTSQSASLFRVNSSVGGSFFEITNSGIVNIKTSTAGDYNSVPLQRWYGDSDSIVGVMQKGGFFYTGYGLGYVDGAGSQTLVHQWVPAGSYYITNWSQRMANGTQIMFSASAGGDVRIYGDTNGSLTFQSYGTYTNNTMVKLLDPNIGTNQALLGVVPQVGGMRSQLYSYGNLSLNMAVAGSAGTDWDTTNLFRANVYTKTKYLGNLAVLAVDDTNRFVVGPYGDTTVSLGGTTVSNALILKGASSQTGNLMEFQSSTGTTYLFINSSGQLGPVTIASTTGSGSTATGALVVSGGVGIGGSLNVYNLSKFSDHLEIKTQKELRLYNSADTNYTALKSAAVSASKTFTLPLDYGTAGQFLYTTDTSGTLDWISDPVQVSSGTANHIAYYASAGNTVSGSSSFTNNVSGGVVSITHATASTNTTTGALVVSGGVGIGGSLRIGDSTNTGSTVSGALVVAGGVGVGGGLYVGTTSQFSGNLTIQGTLTMSAPLQSFNLTGTFKKINSLSLSMSGNGYTNGAIIQVQQANIKETGTAASATVSQIVPAISFRKQSFSATNSGITYTRAATVYIEDAPDSSVVGASGAGTTNTVSITNSYALYVENGRSYFGGAVNSGGNTFTKSLGNGDIALDNGTVDTPGLLMYWGNNKNIGIDTFYSGAGTTRLRIVKELNETGGGELWSVDRNGIVTQSAWAVGETIKTQTYIYSDLSMSGTDPVSITSSSYTTIATASYTPSSSTSYLWIEFSATYDYNGGTGADEFAANIEVGGTEIINVFQKFINGSGGGTRSGVLFPLSGRYTNTGTSALSITVRVKRNSGDDPIRVFGNSGSGLMRIQEIGR
jgi:hypothetical protein